MIRRFCRLLLVLAVMAILVSRETQSAFAQDESEPPPSVPIASTVVKNRSPIDLTPYRFEFRRQRSSHCRTACVSSLWKIIALRPYPSPSISAPASYSSHPPRRASPP